MRITSKLIGSLLLIFIPAILLIVQHVSGVFPFREATHDSTIFTFIVFVAIAGGFAVQGKTPQNQAVLFFGTFGILNIIPMIMNLTLGSFTLIGLEEIFGEFSAGILTPYYLMSAQIGIYPYLSYQLLCLSVPISIMAVSAIKIMRDRCELGLGLLEIFITVVIIIVAAGYGWLGLSYVLA